MRQEILKKLLETTPEEQYIMVSDSASHQDLYSKSGRFIVERRLLSDSVFGESTASFCLKAHPRFREVAVHTHDFIEIMYICSGSITHMFGNSKVVLTEGDVLVIGKNSLHSILTTEKNDIGINLIISHELFENLIQSIRLDSELNMNIFSELLGGNNATYCVFHAGNNVAVNNIMENLIHSVICSDETDSYTLKESLKLLICYLSSINARDSAQINNGSYEDKTKKKIINYIKTSYASATLTEAADMLGLSPTYLSRWICQNFSLSFKELLMNERFQVARELLANTNMSIGDIIFYIGYENTSYFHKEFKKRYGMTPKAFRREYQNKIV